MERLKKALLILLFIFTGFSLLLFFWLSSTLQVTHRILKSDRIQKRIEIKWNRWGVPFIKAETLEDLFFAIGFVHAHDRLYQMELTRRMALGRLSEIFGKITLTLDLHHKEIMVEENIEKIVEKANPEIKRLMEHYSDGINYFIENQNLPLEFKILNYKPEKWKLRDSLCILKLMEDILCGDGSELYNYQILNSLGFERAKKFMYGNYSTTIIKEEEYSRFREKEFLEGIGSNNWVISGKLTETGSPFLANDPHLDLRFPSYFYQIHAETRDLELCGNTLPGAPFVVIGRNKYIGWGFTNIEADVIDYYILKINPENENQYFWDGEWKEFRTLKKVIKVKGGDDVLKEFKATHFGRVMKFKELYLGIQSITDYPSSTMEALLEMNLSRNYEEFLSALQKFSSPPQNVVFADIEGNIGYFPTGLIPVRGKGDGSLPVEAQGKDDLWKGFWEERKKPYIINPERGFIVTANNPVLPENGIPIFSRSWGPFFRADRIEELIKGKKYFTLDDMKEIQTDTLHKGAEFLLKKIKNMKFKSGKAEFVMENFRNWDFRMDKGFSPYLFYNFEYFLSRNIFEDNFKGEDERKLISTSWIYRIMNYPFGYEDEDFYYWIDDLRTEKRESFEDIVEKSLDDTYDRFKEEYKGRDSINWEEIHLIYYNHPFGSIPFLKYFFNRGPYFMKGGRGCVMFAGFSRRDFRITASSSFRMIIDFSDFSRSIIINSSGQSGNILSKNYDDQIKFYVSGDYRLMEERPSGKRTLFIEPLN